VDAVDAAVREALRAEARAGLASGMPKGLAWFPIDRLPEVRWRGVAGPVDCDILVWLVAQAWKAKSPEPTTMLRQRVAQLREDDAHRLGQLALEAWIDHDIRPPSDVELAERRREYGPILAHLAGAPTSDPKMQEALEELLYAPASSAVADKGVLAVAAACAPPPAARVVRGFLDRWYGMRVHQCRALLRMLAWVDRPDAVEVLLSVARRFRTKSIRLEAEVQARRLAERKGVSLAELADESLPDLGLDGDARLLLDFGPRRFRARLDDDAQVVLEDEEGGRLSALPARRKSDDPVRVAEAKMALADLRTRVKAVRTTIAHRFYEAMVLQRRWRFAAWRSSIHGHPVAGRLCRRLVWAVDHAAGAVTTFRPLEDGSLTGPDDEGVDVAADTEVFLAHALTVPDALARRWSEHLADYEVEPLFHQLGGPTFHLADDQRHQTELRAVVAQPLKPQALLGQARARGYDPAAYRWQDGGNCFLKHFPGAELQAVVKVGDHDHEAARSLTLSFETSGAEGRRPMTRRQPLGEVPPVLLSECFSDLLAIAGTGAEVSSP
jgi:hypothetical protein